MGRDVLYVFLVTLLVSMLTNVQGDCAPPEAIFPCTCSQNWLKCGDMTLEKLRAAFDAQKEHPGGRKLETVELADYRPDYRSSYFPSGILSGMDFRSLVVNTSLVTFHDPEKKLSAFSGVEETLTWLTINWYSFVGDFDFSSLSPLKNLYNLFISGSIGKISQPLPPLPTVVNFWFQNGYIHDIHENAFAGLAGVREVRLVDNHFKDYTRSMLPRPANNLTIFITLDDALTVLPDDYFDDMPNLQYVQIPRLAHSIPPLDVTGPTNLQSSRKLTCDCRLKWLLRMRDEGKVNILHAICGRPQHLSGRDVDSLSENDL